MELLVGLRARTSLVDGLRAAGGMEREHHCEDGDSGEGGTSGDYDSGNGGTSGGCDSDGGPVEVVTVVMVDQRRL